MSDAQSLEEYVPPFGARYSQTYLDRGDSVHDSKRLRRRISAFFKNEQYGYGDRCWAALEQRLGAAGGTSSDYYRVYIFLRDSDFVEFADALTVIFDTIYIIAQRSRSRSDELAALAWLKFCQDSFVEENLSFYVDSRCVVHPKFDTEFNNAVNSALSGLSSEKFGAVRHEVEQSVAKLTSLHPDMKGAVRAIFEATEIALKIGFGAPVKRLNRNALLQVLKPAVLSKTETEPEKAAIEALVEGFSVWADACHIYRHGQQVEEPSPPSLATSVLIVSSGLNYLRWLVGIINSKALLAPVVSDVAK